MATSFVRTTDLLHDNINRNITIHHLMDEEFAKEFKKLRKWDDYFEYKDKKYGFPIMLNGALYRSLMWDMENEVVRKIPYIFHSSNLSETSEHMKEIVQWMKSKNIPTDNIYDSILFFHSEEVEEIREKIANLDTYEFCEFLGIKFAKPAPKIIHLENNCLGEIITCRKTGIYGESPNYYNTYLYCNKCDYTDKCLSLF